MKRFSHTALQTGTLRTRIARYTTALGATSVLCSPQQIHFDLSALPVSLQCQFDAAANADALQYLARTQNRTRVEGDDSICTVAVLPHWAHKVTWRCGACNTTWSARPMDRVNPQVGDHFSCPVCQQMERQPHQVEPTETPAVRSRGKSHPSRGDGHSTRHSPSDAVRSAQDRKPSEKHTPRRTRRLLVDAYPTIAAQWDLERNTHHPNRVLQPLTRTTTASAAKVWWTCSLCHRPWLEAVASRVARHEDCLADRCGSTETVELAEARSTFVSLCPSCERRGALDRFNNAVLPVPDKTAHKSVRTLLDDPILLSEARLRPDQNPAEISLHAETILTWQCRYCEHTFQATMAARFERHERCPQCSGRVATPMNLLVIQRPDVVREVSLAISRTRLRHLTTHDDTLELPLVCRTCLSPYRMTPKARCAVPAGVPACPKCLLALSQAVAAAPPPPNPVPAKGARAGHRATLPRIGRPQRQQHKIKRAAHRLSQSGYNGEHMRATANNLRKRDKMLRN